MVSSASKEPACLAALRAPGSLIKEGQRDGLLPQRAPAEQGSLPSWSGREGGRGGRTDEGAGSLSPGVAGKRGGEEGRTDEGAGF